MPIKQTKVWKFFSSMQLAIWLLSIIAVLSLIGTFIPQNEEPGLYIEKFGKVSYELLTKIGLTAIYSSWFFILFLVWLFLNLLVCLLNRFSLKTRSLGTMLSHFSILIILIGSLTSIVFGQKGMIQLHQGEEVNSFQDRRGSVNLGFSIRLNQFIYTEHIDPKEKLLVYSRKAEKVGDIGDSSIPNTAKGLIAQIPTDVGVESEIATTGYRVKILRYVPDFVMDMSTKEALSRSAIPNNPAIEAELKDKDGKTVDTFWTFAAFPEAMHQGADTDFKFVYDWRGRRPKDFISKVTVITDGKEVTNADILVNKPLRFGGYAFFQSSYDSEGLHWTGLQVVKDPGVPIVYAGFIFLVLGLIIIFYVNPLLQRK